MKHWTREEARERFPRPISPLGQSLLRVPLEATLEQLSRTLGLRKMEDKAFVLWHHHYAYTQKNFFQSVQFKNISPWRLWSLGLSCIRAALKASVKRGPWAPLFWQELFLGVVGPELSHLEESGDAQLIKWRREMSKDYQLDPTVPLSFKRFREVRLDMQEVSRSFFADDFNVYLFKKMLFALLKGQLVSGGMVEDKALALLSALSNRPRGNFSVEMVKDFENPEIPVEELKEKYGHLTDNWDLMAPTLGERPEIFERRFCSQVRMADVDGDDPALAIAKALAWNDEVTLLIHWFEKLVLLDEDLRAYSSAQYPQARRLMAMVELTPAFKALQVESGDLYFLTLEEVEEGLKREDFASLKTTLLARKAEWARDASWNPPQDLQEGKEGLRAPLAPRAPSPVGVVVSEGAVRGKVVHLGRGAVLSSISKESILVVESATPVYAPFYARCGGIISETGGHLSHGAIVAREYGIPMMTAVDNACIIFREGDSICLDADQGIISSLSME